MTSTVSVAELTKPIGDFSDNMTSEMRKTVRKHFKEYMLGIMIPLRTGGRAYQTYRHLYQSMIRAQSTGYCMG